MYQYQPLKYYLPTKDKPLKDRWQRLREIGRDILSLSAQLKLEWFIFYFTIGRENAKLTASHFGISRKTFHKWKERFNKVNLKNLEEQSRSPIHKRTWMVTKEQEERIINLRKRYLKYGKQKLTRLYFKTFKENISTWKVERVIRRHKLYPDLEVHKRRVKRQRNRIKLDKIRINKLKESGVKIPPGKLWHTDTINLWWYGQRRIIFTALEDQTKLGYARVYQSGSSRQAKDFLQRLVYLSDGDIKLIHSDNGSEFAGEFEKACFVLNIRQVYSRVRTPRDNPCLERFNWTIQDEWLALSEIGLDDILKANNDLTEWLIEYNSLRPHEALDYLTPLEYAQEKYFKVLPMWSASTQA